MEMEEPTFHPEINPNSKKIKTQAKPSMSQERRTAAERSKQKQ